MKLFLKGDAVLQPEVPDRPRGAAARHARQPPQQDTEYGIRLREKQKLKRFYGMLEAPVPPLLRAGHARPPGTPASSCSRSWSGGWTTSSTGSGSPSAATPARQMVAHGHVMVNGRKCDIPSMLVKPGDMIKVKARDRSLKLARETLAEGAAAGPGLPRADRQRGRPEGRMTRLPSRQDVDARITRHPRAAHHRNRHPVMRIASPQTERSEVAGAKP